MTIRSRLAAAADRVGGRSAQVDGFHLLTPDETTIAKATAAGTFLAVLICRPKWVEIISWFLVGQMTAHYWAIAICIYWMISPDFYSGVGFAIGAFGHLIWSALFQFFEKLKDDPIRTIERLWRTFRGHSGESER